MDDRIFEFMQNTAESLGRIEQGIKNNHEYIENVSGKADVIREELQDHIGNSEAHGLGGERRASGKALQVATAVVAVAGLLMSVYKWGHG